ncbi:hypothetical protein [Paenibacillus massiliensis]|uniref:hypothetical protein n=1 Tax=Paenibacillus massiliensis TaxID=225917 RepID=UPI000361A3C4|nr:hypothetical protein [Paenibacillus massiliensis]
MRGWRIYAVIIICTLLAEGCLNADQGHTPQELYRMASAGIAGKERMSFRGMAAIRRSNSSLFEQQIHYEGSLRGHDVVEIRTILPSEEATLSPVHKTSSEHKPFSIENKGGPKSMMRREQGKWQLNSLGSREWDGTVGRFNPFHQLSQLDRYNKLVSLESGSPRGVKMLRIELTPADAKQMLRDELTTEMENMETHYLKQLQQMDAVATVHKDELRQEIQHTRKQEQSEMLNRLKDAEVRAVYHMTIDKATSLPLRLSSETKLSYKNDPEQGEALVTDVFFEGY